MAELAGRGASWGSILPVNAFAVIRSVGFEPVGQVLGPRYTRSPPPQQSAAPGHCAFPGRRCNANGYGRSWPAAQIAQALYDGRGANSLQSAPRLAHIVRGLSRLCLLA
jgi:hypothetical protein